MDYDAHTATIRVDIRKDGDKYLKEVTDTDVKEMKERIGSFFEISGDSPSDPIAKKPTEEQLEWSARVAVAQEKMVDEKDILSVLEALLDEKSRTFAGQMSQLNYGQKETLIAIAKAGKATGVTSVAFIKKNALKSPSSVQYAISTLLDSQILTYEQEGRTKTYSLEDRFLEMWIRRTY